MRLFGIHHHHNDDPLAGASPLEVECFFMLAYIIERLETMSVELDNLTAQVTANSTLLDSATTLINGIADRITAAGVDPTKLAALSAELKSKDDALAAAVVANTPAATP